MNKEQIILAVDKADFSNALHLARTLQNYIGFIKLGLEFYLANGLNGVNKIAELGVPIFLDLKLYDIPNTINGAISSIISTHDNIQMLTLHAQGGKQMLTAAAESARNTSEKFHKKKPLLLGVTVLTSIDEAEFSTINLNKFTISEQALNLADIAHKSSMDGIICSPLEVTMLKKKFGNNLKLITPGIKITLEDKPNDQKRTATAQKTIEQGADYLVIGRSITQSKDPVAVIQSIIEQT